MVVPLELDPGRYDPKSPYYEPSDEELRAQREAELEEQAMAEAWERKLAKRQAEHQREQEAYRAFRELFVNQNSQGVSN